MEGSSPQERLPKLKRNHPDSQPGGQVGKSCRTNKRAYGNLIVLDSDTEDEEMARVADEVSLNSSQWIDLTNYSPSDVSIIKEKRGRGLTSPMLFGVSRQDTGKDEQSQNRGQQVQSFKSRRRREAKSTIATVDLTSPGLGSTAESSLTYRADPVAKTSEVVDLTIPNVDLTSSEVDLNIATSLNSALLCPVCLDPLFELNVGRLIFANLSYYLAPFKTGIVFRDALSTPCGHLICSTCLPRALQANGRCPKCRKEILLQDAIKIHL